jgi:hypothetical protein
VRLLKLYPRAWRERYGAEMLALLEQHDVTLATRLDLLRGAWDARTEQRRYVMAVLPAAAWRGARLGLIPCVFPLAWFLLSLDLHADTTLLNLLFFMSPPSIAAMLLVCLWAGKREAEGDSAWGGRLAAGAAAGIVGLLGSIAVQDGLMLTHLGLGVSSHVIALQGGSVSGSQTFVFAPGTLVSPSSLFFDAIAFAVAGALGASVGALGTALAGVRLTRDARSV